jgi:aminoglycoside phosphotransferase (APT) family kinase protein
MATAPVAVDAGFAPRIAAAAGPGVVVRRLEVLSGGHSGVTHVADLDHGDRVESVVIKSAPPGRRPEGRHDVLRQAAVIAGLGARGEVPVPSVRFSDAGDPPFFATDLVPGVAVDPIIDPDRMTVAPDEVAARWDAAIDVLATLHRTPVDALRLADVTPRPPADELAIWEATMRAAKMDDDRNTQRALAAMRERVPEPSGASVVHGDFRLGNILFDGATPRAVIDWEIWSVGDPAMDLGWFISFTDARNYPGVGHEVPGTPTAAAVLTRYAELIGERRADLAWFLALGSFKLAAIQAHNRRRHLEGRYHDEFQSLLGPSIERLLDLTLMRLDANPYDD